VNENRELGTVLFVHKKITSAVKRVEFVSDRMSYWYDNINLNDHAPANGKIDDMM
jgi:uncharacterized protein (DUF2164 family)